LATTPMLDAAMVLHRQGRLREAETQYRGLLAQSPDQFEALHLLGILKLQQGDHPEALTLMSRALDSNPSSLDTRANLVAVLLNLGRPADALTHCDAILAITPQEVGTLFNRAVAFMQLGRTDDALEGLRRVLTIKPDHVNAMFNRATVLAGSQRFDEAIAQFNRLLALMPGHVDALTNLGTLQALLGRGAEALASFDRALVIAPNHVNALTNRGVALKNVARHQEALASLDRAIMVRPDHAEAHVNRGNVLVALARYDEALASYDRVIALAPRATEGHLGRAEVLVLCGRTEEALASLEQALAVSPDHIEVLVAHGNVLGLLGRSADSQASYDRALALAPNDRSALMGRAAALLALGRREDALAALDRILVTTPADVDALSNRGFLLQSLGRHAEASASLDQALQVDPRHAGALNNQGILLLDLGRPREAIESYRQALAVEHTPDRHSNLIFALNFDPDANAEVLAAERSRWHQQYAAPFVLEGHANTRDPDRRLRIGYLSSHFRRHAATYAFACPILHRDRDQFEAVCYAIGPSDDVGDQLRASADRWRQVDGRSDQDVAGMIRADGIDILVDLVGHMQGQRLQVFARKPAPVQVSGWGEPTGTGLHAMDYLFADPVLLPSEQRSLLAERVHDLPNFLGYWTPDRLPDPSPLPAMDRGFVTFGSFNRMAKIQDPVLRCWAAILRALPTARLVIKTEHQLHGAGRLAEMQAVLVGEAIAADRVDFRPFGGRDAHFASYQDIDIALDPFPHGGGMTTLDALWMGVPVVTEPGKIISSRLAAASLSALGLTDFVAGPGSYADLAVEKARDIQALATLRMGLRARMTASAIGDPVRYARAVEQGYRTMWRDWCASTGGA
jgi:protein O-GlcNAc transferase